MGLATMALHADCGVCCGVCCGVRCDARCGVAVRWGPAIGTRKLPEMTGDRLPSCTPNCWESSGDREHGAGGIVLPKGITYLLGTWRLLLERVSPVLRAAVDTRASGGAASVKGMRIVSIAADACERACGECKWVKRNGAGGAWPACGATLAVLGVEGLVGAETCPEGTSGW